MNLGLPELIVIFIIILLVFGAGKIPAIARDMGKGFREFKRAMNSDDEEDEKPAPKRRVKAVTKKRVKKT